jgi:hypothetical protein
MGLFNTLTEATYQRLTLMNRMLERLDVDTAKVVCADLGTTFRAIVGRCRGCHEPDLCARWLDGQEVGIEHSQFCPNAKTFAPFRQ